MIIVEDPLWSNLGHRHVCVWESAPRLPHDVYYCTLGPHSPQLVTQDIIEALAQGGRGLIGFPGYPDHPLFF